jgi:hypothetical protein
MSHHKPEEARSDPGRRRIKREVLFMSLLAAALIIGGGVYTALRGTPEAGRDAIGPVEVHSGGPATMPGAAAMERHPTGDAPSSSPSR